MPINKRQATRDTWLPLGGGKDGKEPVFVSKGTCVNFSYYSLYRRKDLYADDSELFRPERWEEGKNLDNSYQFLTFHQGLKRCVARTFSP